MCSVTTHPSMFAPTNYDTAVLCCGTSLRPSPSNSHPSMFAPFPTVSETDYDPAVLRHISPSNSYPVHISMSCANDAVLRLYLVILNISSLLRLLLRLTNQRPEAVGRSFCFSFANRLPDLSEPHASNAAAGDPKRIFYFET